MSEKKDEVSLGAVVSIPLNLQVSAAPFAIPAGVDFKNWLAANMETFPATLDLPPEYLEIIGKIVVHWAYEEWFLAGIINTIIGIDRKEGRVLFVGGRVPDAVTKIRQLCEIRDFKIPEALLADVATAVRAADASRNLVSHAVWVKDGEALLAQDPSGEWKIEGRTMDMSKRRYPEGVPVDLDVLNDKFSDVLHAIELTKQLEQQIRNALPGKI